MFAKQSNGGIAATLVLAVVLWGGSNAGTKFLVKDWPPVFIGCTRLFGAGLILLAILRWTAWLGNLTALTAPIRRQLWLRGGFSLAVYIIVFNFALKFSSASHVALYLGAAPIWALLWEERPQINWRSAQRYGAAALAFSGVMVLCGPSLKTGSTQMTGELLGVATSILWTHYSRQCRALGAGLSGAEVSAHTMWRAGAILIPFSVMEVWLRNGIVWRTNLVLAQTYCLIAGGVMAYALWNNGLRHWPTSKVFLFNNLIPLATMTWAWACLGEPITAAFWIAMILVVAGVVLGQTNWQRVLGRSWVPTE